MVLIQTLLTSGWHIYKLHMTAKHSNISPNMLKHPETPKLLKEQSDCNIKNVISIVKPRSNIQVWNTRRPPKAYQ